MSAIRELEERISAHAGVLPYVAIAHDVMRPNDWPMDVQLYNDIQTSFCTFYARVADAKKYEEDMKNGEANEAEAD